MDTKMDRMMQIVKDIDKETKRANASVGGDKPQQAVTGELSAELQATSQELQVVTNALNTLIQAISESVATMARKQ